MVSVHEQIELGAAPEKVWELIADFGGLLAALGVQVEVEGSGVGAVRTVHHDGAVIVERLEELDNATMQTSYSMLEANPFSVAGYLATAQVSAAGAGRTLLTWRSSFEPDGVTEEAAEAAIRAVYRDIFAALTDHFGA
jgi:carbon monoxide dehydrogenase subunit G